MGRCSYCDEEIQDGVTKCQYCGEWLESKGKKPGKLSPEEIAQMRREMAHPDVRPCTFDVTFEGWLRRLSLWGKIKTEHIDPEISGRTKKKCTQRQLIKRLSDPELVKAFGHWGIKALDYNKVSLYRDYVGYNGKTCKEQFIVTVDVKDEIKNYHKKHKW